MGQSHQKEKKERDDLPWKRGSFFSLNFSVAYSVRLAVSPSIHRRVQVSPSLKNKPPPSHWLKGRTGHQLHGSPSSSPLAPSTCFYLAFPFVSGFKQCSQKLSFYPALLAYSTHSRRLFFLELSASLAFAKAPPPFGWPFSSGFLCLTCKFYHLSSFYHRTSSVPCPRVLALERILTPEVQVPLLRTPVLRVSNSVGFRLLLSSL